MWTQNASLLDLPLSWGEALHAIKELNKSDLSGYHNWKMPNRRHSPALPDSHSFNEVQAFYC